MKRRFQPDYQQILTLAAGHPAREFLCAFTDCLDRCGGCELGLYEQPIDQRWVSSLDGEEWTFSTFVYKYLAVDLLLDGFVANSDKWTTSESWALSGLPRFRILIAECTDAAARCGNADCLELTSLVTRMLDRWDEYLDFRRKMIADNQS
jgi:hypothetical protein